MSELAAAREAAAPRVRRPRLWELVAPPGAVLVEVPLWRRRRRASQREVRRLPSGTAVVLLDPHPGARRRCRRFAGEAELAPGRAYLALPSLRAQLVLVEDHRVPIGYTGSRLLTVPPGVAAFAAPVAAALKVLHLPAAWRLLGALAPSLVVVGWRR